MKEDVAANTFAMRHRERQLRRLSRNTRITTTTTRLFTAGAWVSIIIAFVIIIPYAVTELLVARHRSRIAAIADAAQGAVLANMLATDVRRLHVAGAQLAAADDQVASAAAAYAPLWYTPTNTSEAPAAAATALTTAAGQYAGVYARMVHNSEELEALHRSMYTSVAVSAESATTPVHDLFDMAAFTVVRTVQVAEPYTLLVKMGLWELGRSFALATRAAANVAAGIVGTATAYTPGTTAPDALVRPGAGNSTVTVPYAALTPLCATPEFHFVLSNAPGPLAAGWRHLVTSSADAARSAQSEVASVQVAAFVAQLTAPLLLLLLLIRPLMVKVANERMAMFQVFVRIPTEVVQRLSRLPINVGETHSDDSSEEEDADGGGGLGVGPDDGAGTGMTTASSAPTVTSVAAAGGRSSGSAVPGGKASSVIGGGRAGSVMGGGRSGGSVAGGGRSGGSVAGGGRSGGSVAGGRLGGSVAGRSSVAGGSVAGGSVTGTPSPAAISLQVAMQRAVVARATPSVRAIPRTSTRGGLASPMATGSGTPTAAAPRGALYQLGRTISNAMRLMSGRRHTADISRHMSLRSVARAALVRRRMAALGGSTPGGMTPGASASAAELHDRVGTSGGDSDPGAPAVAVCTRAYLRGSLRRFRMSMSPRLWAATILVTTLVVLQFVSGFLLVATASAASVNLEVAGMRSALVVRVKFFAQELVTAATALHWGGEALAPYVTVSGLELAARASGAFNSDAAVVADLARTPSRALLSDTDRSLAGYVAYARAGLLDAAATLEAYHSALLYGSDALSIDGQVYTSQRQADLLFASGCLRTAGACVPPTHPYYRVTTSGMHGLLLQYVSQARQLANESVAAIAAGSATPGSTATGLAAVAGATDIWSGFRNARLEFLWSVGEADLANGMATAMSGYLTGSLAYAQSFSIANGILFASIMFMLAAMYFILFRPRIKQMAAESHRAASLLRSLPVGVDLDLLQRAAVLADPSVTLIPSAATTTVAPPAAAAAPPPAAAGTSSSRRGAPLPPAPVSRLGRQRR